jgi:hypothetical protein
MPRPGWALKVDLKGTHPEQMPFSPIMIQRENENDWVHCQVENDQFRGYCGPNNLTELMEVFLGWVESAQN